MERPSGTTSFLLSEPCGRPRHSFSPPWKAILSMSLHTCYTRTFQSTHPQPRWPANNFSVPVPNTQEILNGLTNQLLSWGKAILVGSKWEGSSWGSEIKPWEDTVKDATLTERHWNCSAVFTWTNLLVVVVELCGSEQEALDLVPLVTNVVLEEHYLIVGVVVVVDPGVIPINSRGEKQRMHLRDSFLADQLDPIYVAYNM